MRRDIILYLYYYIVADALVIRVISAPSGEVSLERKRERRTTYNNSGLEISYLYIIIIIWLHIIILCDRPLHIYYYNTLVYGYVKRTSGAKIYGPV